MTFNNRLFVVMALNAMVSGLDVNIKKHGTDGAHISVEGQQKNQDSGNSMTNYFFNVFAGCCSGGDKPPTTKSPPPEQQDDVELRFEPWIMSLTGGDPHRDDAEILSLDEANHPVPACLRHIKKYPVKIEGSVGGSVQGGKVPLVCGGPHLPFSEQCYKYIPERDDWEKLGRTRSPRGRSRASLHSTRGLIISGGISSGHYTAPVLQATVESSNDGFSFRSDYASMPVAVDLHCQLRLDDDTIFVAGGRLNYTAHSNRAFIFDISANQWTELPSMTLGRQGAGCGVVRDPATGRPKKIVITGGYNGGYQSSTEEFNLNTKTWGPGTAFPQALSWPFSVAHRNAFVVIGGEGNKDTIYEFDPAGSGGAGSWVLLPARLMSPKHEPTAFKVRKDIFPKCG